MSQPTPRLSPLAMGVTLAVLLCGGIFLVGLVAMAAPGYGDSLLAGFASIYPGYDNSGTFGDLLIGLLFVTIDVFVGGLVFAWLYNRVAACLKSPDAGGSTSEPAAG